MGLLCSSQLASLANLIAPILPAPADQLKLILGGFQYKERFGRL